MNDPAIRRWNPGFVAMRWRHAFWIVPLLGVLAALAAHLAFHHRTDVRAVIQIQMGSSWPPSPSMEEMLRSDEVLRGTIRELGLAARWKANEEDAVERLRRQTVMSRVHGTLLIDISHLSFRPATAMETALSLARQFQSEVERHQRSFHTFELRRLQSEVERHETEIERLRERIARKEEPSPQPRGNPVILTGPLIKPHAPNLGGDMQLAGYETGPPVKPPAASPKDALEKAQEALAKAKLDHTAVEMQVSNAIRLHQSPSLTQAVLPAAKRLGIGLSIAILVTPAIAYLLELLFPRKLRPQEIPASTVSGETATMP